MSTPLLLQTLRRFRAALAWYEATAPKWPHHWAFARGQVASSAHAAASLAWARAFRGYWK